jgi:predicted MPP superfamily phosphohydrolase
VLKTTLVILGLVLLACVAYGVGVEPRFLLDRQEIEAEVPDLPDGWNGQKVALLADFQIGMWLGNVGMAEKAVRVALDANPALVLIAGDFLYQPDFAKADRAVEIVRPLVEADVPVVAVLGNHDYSLMKKSSNERPRIAEYLEQRLRAVGVTVLENDALAVPAPDGGDSLWVAGIGSVWAEADDADAALDAVPDGAPRLVLMHNAEAYRDIPGGEAPLALAAHTHGGQVRLFGTPRWSWLDIVKDDEAGADGWVHSQIGAEGNRLYINRGIGFSTAPIRFNCRPELTTITLRRRR